MRGYGQLRVMTGAAALSTLAAPMAVSAAGYIKIPDIAGESRAKDSGEAHLDYLTITLNADGVETEDIGFKANEADETDDDHSAGDEHEIEYDVSAGAFKQDAPMVPGVTWSPLRPTDDSGHGSRPPSRRVSEASRPQDDSAHGSRLTGIRAHKPLRATSDAPRDTATGLPTGKRQHKPLKATKPVDKASPLLMTAAAAWKGCAVGARYPHIVLGDGEGKEYRIEGVRVTHCEREHVSFTYKKIVD